MASSKLFDEEEVILTPATDMVSLHIDADTDEWIQIQNECAEWYSSELCSAVTLAGIFGDAGGGSG